MAKMRATAGGSVDGSVSDAKANLPLRFALIRLVPVPSGPEPVPIDPASVPPGTGFSREPRLEVVEGLSGMDGSFHLGNVPAGDYFVVAKQAGYLAPGGIAFSNGLLTAESSKLLAGSVQTAHVRVGQAETVRLALQRGASVEGHVHFADGSPMIGAGVTVEPLTEPVPFTGKTTEMDLALARLIASGQVRQDTMTDDAGQFHVSGLPAGKYIVTTGFALDHTSGHVSFTGGGGAQTSGREHMFPEMISVYQPGVFRRKSARVLDLQEGEQVRDADIVVNTDGLHTVRGKVLGKGDSRAPGGFVQLREDVTRNEERMAELEEDGSFELNDLPSGTYTLKVNASNSVNLPEDLNRHDVVIYKDVKIAVVVGEHDVMLPDLLLDPLKPGEQPPPGPLF